jgi:assimilatory nitrate reductase catalytic subunit
VVDTPTAPPEAPDADHPFVLLTGRGSSAQWHTETRTGKSALLRTLSSDVPYVEVNPSDARRLGIAAGQWVLVRSCRGEAELKAFLTPTVQPGHVFAPMHDATTNRLTLPAFDPHSRQPAYKYAAVALRPVALSGGGRDGGGAGASSTRDASADGGRVRAAAPPRRARVQAGCLDCSPGTGTS